MYLYFSSLVFEGLLQPWSSSLVNLLSDERGISPETFSVVVDAMAAAVQHGNTAIIEALPMKMECLFGMCRIIYVLNFIYNKFDMKFLLFFCSSDLFKCKEKGSKHFIL